MAVLTELPAVRTIPEKAIVDATPAAGLASALDTLETAGILARE